MIHQLLQQRRSSERARERQVSRLCLVYIIDELARTEPLQLSLHLPILRGPPNPCTKLLKIPPALLPNFGLHRISELPCTERSEVH